MQASARCSAGVDVFDVFGTGAVLCVLWNLAVSVVVWSVGATLQVGTAMLATSGDAAVALSVVQVKKVNDMPSASLSPLGASGCFRMRPDTSGCSACAPLIPGQPRRARAPQETWHSLEGRFRVNPEAGITCPRP